MFDNLRAGARKRRRRKSMRHGRSRLSRRRMSNLGPILKIGGLVLAVAALVCLVIFVIIPMFGGEKPEEVESTPTVEATPSPTPEPTQIASPDMSEGVDEFGVDYKSVNDPFVYGDSMIFTSGTKTESAPDINTLVLYDIPTKTTEVVPGIEMKYVSLFEPKMNDNFIVYLDCKSEYGGAVMGYDRVSGESFVMREYLFGKPKVSLSGEYALWMQQTGGATDKLYLYHLPTKEHTVIEIFVNTPFSICSVDMDDSSLIYVEPYGERQVPENSSSSMEAEIVVMPLSDGGDEQAVLYRPGVFVYDPKIDGDYIAFLDGPRSLSSNLMVCGKEGDTYSAPETIATGVLSFDVGDGYVVYTLETTDEETGQTSIGVYIYYFEDGSTGRLSSDTTRAILASANGKDVVWYDITDGLGAGANVIKHIKVP